MNFENVSNASKMIVAERFLKRKLKIEVEKEIEAESDAMYD